MTRRRTLFLLLVFLPVYTWLMLVIMMIGWGLLVEPSVDLDDLLEVFNPLAWISLLDDEGAIGLVLVPGLLLIATQVGFLLPVVAPHRFLKAEGKSLRLTVIAAALVGGVLTVGLVFALSEVVNAWEYVLDVPGEAVQQSGIIGTQAMDAASLALWGYLVVGWLIWLPIVAAFARRQPSGRLHGRLLGLLLAGTVLETLFVLPIDIMVRRRTNCYCDTGTFFSLCISIWAALWLTGPGIVFMITSRRRRWWAETHCLRCGYLKGPKPGRVCPECGHEWATPLTATSKQ